MFFFEEKNIKNETIDLKIIVNKWKHHWQSQRMQVSEYSSKT